MMTEEEWLKCDDPHRMVMSLRRAASSQRKSRLFAVMACRRFWTIVTDERSRKAVEVAELYLDGQASEEDRGAAAEASREAISEIVRIRQADYSFPEMFIHAARACAIAIAFRFSRPDLMALISACNLITRDPKSPIASRKDEKLAASATLRDIFGSPFRPVSLFPDCRTSTSVAIAKQIYDSRDFSAMPILADALQDADCDNADILDHCRGPGPHVRGCWVVDLVLDKK